MSRTFVHVHEYDEILKKYFKLPGHITYHILEKKSIFFRNQFFSVTSGAPSKRCATSKFEIFLIFLPLDLKSPITFFLLGFWGF